MEEGRGRKRQQDSRCNFSGAEEELPLQHIDIPPCPSMPSGDSSEKIYPLSLEEESDSHIEPREKAALSSVQASSLSSTSSSSPSTPWSVSFLPRPVTEVTKNCTQVDHSVKEYVVHTIAAALLSCSPRWVAVGGSGGVQEDVTPLKSSPAVTDTITDAGLVTSMDGMSSHRKLWNRGGIHTIVKQSPCH